MAKITIDKGLCKGCRLCVVYCPRELITVSEKLNQRGVNPAVFNDKGSECTGCTFCALICPDCAIEVYK